LILPIIAYTLFNKIRDKDKIVFAWYQGVRELGEGGRNDPNICIETYICIYEYNKKGKIIIFPNAYCLDSFVLKQN
jgi:hypothetical protein